MSDKIVSIPGASRTLKALSDLGYDFNSAVADLIDNSITRGCAENIFIYFDKIEHKKKVEIKFRLFDDGVGMSQPVLEESMRFGNENVSYSEGDLSKYGMGMKTASLSQCELLTALSKSKNNEPTGYRWDMEHVHKFNNWSLLKLDKKEINTFIENNNKMFVTMFGNIVNDFLKGNHWTLISWDKLSGMDYQYNSRSKKGFSDNFLENTIGELVMHVSLTFHRFLAGENGARKININFNGQVLKPFDPFCRKQKHTLIYNSDKEKEKISFIFDNIRGKKRNPVIIKRYILPAKTGRYRFDSANAWEGARTLKSWNDSQGYYIYRNNRLISYGGWLRTKAKDEHDKLARVSIDFTENHDDLVRIDVKKTRIQIPDELFNFLKNTVNPKYIKAAKDRYNNSEEKATTHKNSVRQKNNKVSHLSESLFNTAEIRVTEDRKKEQIEVSNKYGKFITDDLIYKTLMAGHRFVEQDFYDDKIFWQLVPNPDCGFQIIINKSHPLYEKYYLDDSKNNVVTAVIESFLFTMAFIEMKCRTTENNWLFEEIKEASSEVLKKFVTEKII